MISRRNILGGVGALTVLGFSTVARAWVGAPAASLAHVPDLDGELLTDPSSLASASTDAGYAETAAPLAVLRPGSVRDIQEMIRFCKRHDILVSARGQGHTTHGQGLNRGGLVIEMASLNQVHHIGRDFATVGAGLKWSELLAQTVARGLAPPALTGYLGLSVGGTLSVGGISSTNRAGAQVDNVREIEFVNGKGQLQKASPRKNRELFDGVLAGLGQLGIITQVTLELEPAPSLVRVYTIDYTDAALFFADMRTLLKRGEFEDCYNFGIPDGAGGYGYQLTVAKSFEPGAPPDTNQLLRGLSVAPGVAAIQDMPFEQFALRVDMAIEFFRSIGLWEGVQHPWFDVFLPDRTVESYVTRVTAELTFEDVGPTGFLLLFPQKSRNFERPLLRIPDCDEWVFLFDILTAAPAPGFSPAFDAQMRARNRRLYDQARAVGGTRYPIGTLDFSPADWRRHYGSAWSRFADLKRQESRLHLDAWSRDFLMMPRPAPEPRGEVLLGDIAFAKLDALAEALDLPEREAQRIARVFEILSSPWALWPSGETAPWPSDISDDGSPFEFSAAFDGGEPKLRLLVESQGVEQTATSTFEAGLALNERLRNAGLVDLTAFNRIVDLFTPSRAPSRFQLWHAAELGPEDCLYKAYLNPQILGPGVAHELLHEALVRLDMPHAWEQLAPHLSTPAQRAELRYISVDLEPLGEARVKVYLGRSSAAEVEHLLSGLWPREQARSWLSDLSGFEGPYTARPVLTCFSFRPGEERPEATLHVPVRCYVPNDAEAAARAGRYLRPADAERLTRALRAVAGRPLRSGRGLLTYVSLRAAQTGLRVTTYIAPEVYSIQAQRPSGNAEHASERRIRIPRAETTTFGDVLQLIARRGEIFGEHPFLVHLEGNGTLDEVRLFAPRLSFFVMCFQDVLRLAHKSTIDPEMRAIAATHLAEDRGHDRWFLADLEKLGVPLNVEGLFHHGHESTRDVAYSLVSLVLAARDDSERFAVSMSLEAMAGQFFGRILGFMERMGEDQFDYFGRRHQAVEASHRVFEEEEHARVAALEIQRLAVPDVVAAIDKTFAVLTALADELWDALRRHRSTAPPAAG